MDGLNFLFGSTIFQVLCATFVVMGVILVWLALNPLNNPFKENKDPVTKQFKRKD